MKNDQHKTVKIKKLKTDNTVSPFVNPLFMPTALVYVVVDISVIYLYVVVHSEL